MKYDQDFKQQVLDYQEDGKSIRETARTFRISPQTVINMKHGHYKKPSFARKRIRKNGIFSKIIVQFIKNESM